MKWLSGCWSGYREWRLVGQGGRQDADNGLVRMGSLTSHSPGPHIINQAVAILLGDPLNLAHPVSLCL